MTTFRQFSAVVAAVAVSLALLAPLPARADHESTTQPPQQRPQEPTRLPGAKEAWDDGFYYALDFTLGDSANPNTDAGFSVDLDWSSSAGFGVGYRLGPLRLEGQLLTQFYRVGSLDLTGGGLARVSADYNESVCYIFCFSTQNEIVDDWDKVNAWQGMLGVSFASASPNMEWYIGYRYYETEDLDFRTLSGVPFRQEGLQDHAFMFGFRFLTN
jgi:opacity protein-like surface antigen